VKGGDPVDDDETDYENALEAEAEYYEDEDGYYGPTDEFFYADEWDLEEPYDAQPYEDDCYEGCF
jgi:hypothetical protein